MTGTRVLRSEVTEAELEAALLRVPPVAFSREEPTLVSSSSLMSWRERVSRGSQRRVGTRAEPRAMRGAGSGRAAKGDETYQASLLQQRQHAHGPIRVGAARVGIRSIQMGPKWNSQSLDSIAEGRRERLEGGEVERWVVRREVELRSADLGGKTVRGSSRQGPRGPPGVRGPAWRSPQRNGRPKSRPHKGRFLTQCSLESYSSIPPRHV